MAREAALLFTDIVDSTSTTQRLGNDRAAHFGPSTAGALELGQSLIDEALPMLRIAADLSVQSATEESMARCFAGWALRFSRTATSTRRDRHSSRRSRSRARRPTGGSRPLACRRVDGTPASCASQWDAPLVLMRSGGRASIERRLVDTDVSDAAKAVVRPDVLNQRHLPELASGNLRSVERVKPTETPVLDEAHQHSDVAEPLEALNGRDDCVDLGG